MTGDYAHRMAQKGGKPRPRSCGALSGRGPGPQQRRFGFGYQTAHDLSHRQDFLDAARGLSGSEKCLVRPTGLMRRQDLLP